MVHPKPQQAVVLRQVVAVPIVAVENKMANQPMPVPPLDGVPPSPAGLGASQNPNPPIGGLAPKPNMGGSMQVAQMAMGVAADIAKGLDLLGQIIPTFQPTAQMLLSQLRDGFKSALQQGLQGSEPSLQSASQGLGVMQGQQIAGAPQTELPSLPSGMGQ